MRKTKNKFFSIITSVFIFSITFSCVEQTKKSDPYSSSGEEVKAPEQIVSLEQAKKMYDTYTERRAPLIQKYEDSINMGRSEFDVARYTYYDYKTIKQYLAYVEQEAALAGVEISTLRFYFSNYPDEPTFEDGRRVIHPRQNSFFILPTLQKDGEEFGFYTADSDQEGRRNAVLISGQLKEYAVLEINDKAEENKKSYAGFVPLSASFNVTGTNLNYFQGKKSLILNEGSSAPPPNN